MVKLLPGRGSLPASVVQYWMLLPKPPPNAGLQTPTGLGTEVETETSQFVSEYVYV